MIERVTTPHYLSSYLGTFRDTTRLLEFQNHTKSIIEHGLDQRLTKTKQGLNDIVQFDLKWTAQMEISSSRHPKRSVAENSSSSNFIVVS